MKIHTHQQGGKIEIREYNGTNGVYGGGSVGRTMMRYRNKKTREY